MHSAGQLRSGKLQIDVVLMNLKIEPVLQIWTVQGALTELLIHEKGGILITPLKPDVVGSPQKRGTL